VSNGPGEAKYSVFSIQYSGDVRVGKTWIFNSVLNTEH
jgi:hypothetical protein